MGLSTENLPIDLLKAFLLLFLVALSLVSLEVFVPKEIMFLLAFKGM